jgi:hypothetical protein
VQHPRRQSSLYSPPWEPEISPFSFVRHGFSFWTQILSLFENDFLAWVQMCLTMNSTRQEWLCVRWNVCHSTQKTWHHESRWVEPGRWPNTLGEKERGCS